MAWDAARRRWLVTTTSGSDGSSGRVATASAGGDSVRRQALGGGRGGLRLEAPRGIAVQGDTAWIADVRRLVAVDLARDTVALRVPIDGAGRLDDVAPTPQGPLYVSDPGAGAVWRVARDGSGARRLGAVGELRGPDGLLAEGGDGGPGSLLMAGREGAVLALTADSAVTLLAESPSFRRLDGLQRAPDGGLLAGDRAAGRIFHLRRRSPEVWRTGEAWLTGLSGPADFLVRDSVLVVPEADAGRLTAYRIRGR